MPLVDAAESQCARTVMMIRPVRFRANEQTRASNAFQRDGLKLDPTAQQAAAHEAFEALVARLDAAGVETCVFDDTPEPLTPDSVFPNNWVSFHEDGRVVLYPMMAENRRLERRVELIEQLCARGFLAGERVDLSAHEEQARFLEGTGSLVLDRTHRVAYACRSPRTDRTVLAEFAARMGYEAVSFDAVGPDGRAVYHTNVMMSIGDGFAAVCAEAIASPEAREAVLARLRATGREVVELDMGQMLSFAGNMHALRARDGTQVLAMSRRAESSLRPAQRAALARHARLVAAPIEAIEDAAGGSVRCMLAEVFLPRLVS